MTPGTVVVIAATAVLIVILVLATAATILGHRGSRGLPVPGVRVVKTLYPVSLLLMLLVVQIVWGGGTGIGTWFVVAVIAGLVATAFADWMLAPVDNSRTFAAGLAGFLLGYLLYGIGILTLVFDTAGAAGAAGVVGNAGVARVVPAAATIYTVVGAVGYLQYRRLTSVPAQLRIPVIAYLVVVSNLLAAGLLLAGVGSGADTSLLPSAVAPLILGGVVLIYASDSLIAHNLFRSPLRREELWILPPYYLGQVAITAAAVAILLTDVSFRF